MLKRHLGESYSPLYFLAALGPGGLAVSFFMYLMFLVPHKGTPMAALKHWLPLVEQGGLTAILILAVLAIFIALALLHFALMIWNFQEFKEFKLTSHYQQLKQSNGEVTLMAAPLAVAMSINLLFIIGSLFVPNLWSFVQALFPFASIGFALVGLWAMKIYGQYMMRLFEQGDFNHQINNSFAQLLGPFTFSMIAVGLAAPGAMSHSTLVSGLSLGLSSLFVGLTVILSVVWLFASLKQISSQGFDKSAAPTLWILIPILTLVGITFVRQTMGVHHNFAAELQNSNFLQIMSLFLGLQLVIGLFGYRVMKNMGYFEEFVHGDKHSPASFGLVCPGVALVVFGFFFINYALIMNGVIDKYSLAHWGLIVPFTTVQIITGWIMLKLIKRQIVQPTPLNSQSA